MASNRHLGRIVALQTLYEYDFRSSVGDKNVDVDSILSRNIRRYRDSIEDKRFVKTITDGVLSKEIDLNTKLQELAPQWPIMQIARVDRVVLQLGAFELLHSKEVPPKVAINEAVELAKSFGNESSSRFVNGVLGTLYREMSGQRKIESSTTEGITKKQVAEIK